MRKGSLPLLLASLLAVPLSMAEPNAPQALPITIQTGNPHAEELAALRQQLAQSEQLRVQQADSGEQDSALANRLRQENQRLKLQLKQALAQSANGPLLTEQQTWFATGAGVAVLAFLLGIFTGGRRNKRQSQWV